MTAIFEDDDEELAEEVDPLLEDDDAVISLDDVENLEEEENTGHRVTTFDAKDDGEGYFDGAYFDE